MICSIVYVWSSWLLNHLGRASNLRGMFLALPPRKSDLPSLMPSLLLNKLGLSAFPKQNLAVIRLPRPCDIDGTKVKTNLLLTFYTKPTVAISHVSLDPVRYSFISAN